ncbi:PilZ domain-containing protein [Lichenihabitans psoromatis]|uniref:PilZ domain-containing protein n=1 Tax=Lichenihabitans psoromatis TaxID=2528642 RepID=UPI001035D4D1|nr:PilZ domain-containing protein [Lichenihabitans psoromatis]
MTIAHAPALFQSASRGVTPPGAERRRHQRVRVQLLGRYMLGDRQEYPCQAIDMSPGGASLVAAVKGITGDRVVCHLDQIGRVEGVIARLTETGFAIQISVPLVRREKLAEQLTWLANRQALGLLDGRRHIRIVPRLGRTTVTTQDVKTMPARLLDVSLSGAALQCDIRPAIGATVSIGNTRGRVVRASAGCLGIEFDALLPIDTFDEHIVL